MGCFSGNLVATVGNDAATAVSKNNDDEDDDGEGGREYRDIKCVV